MSASNESDAETVKTLLSLAPQWFMLMPSADNLQSIKVQESSELTGVTDNMLRALLALPGCLTVDVSMPPGVTTRSIATIDSDDMTLDIIQQRVGSSPEKFKRAQLKLHVEDCFADYVYAQDEFLCFIDSCGTVVATREELVDHTKSHFKNDKHCDICEEPLTESVEEHFRNTNDLDHHVVLLLLSKNDKTKCTLDDAVMACWMNAQLKRQEHELTRETTLAITCAGFRLQAPVDGWVKQHRGPHMPASQNSQ